MPDREHAAMDGMQARATNSAIDRAPPDAGGEELGPRHHAMLAPGKRRDHGIRRSRRTFAIAIGANVRLDRHATIVAPCASQITTESSRFGNKTPPNARGRPPCAPPPGAGKTAAYRAELYPVDGTKSSGSLGTTAVSAAADDAVRCA